LLTNIRHVLMGDRFWGSIFRTHVSWHTISNWSKQVSRYHQNITYFHIDLLQDPHCPCVKTSTKPPQSELKYCWGFHRILEFYPMCKYQMTSITKTNNWKIRDDFLGRYYLSFCLMNSSGLRFPDLVIAILSSVVEEVMES
jgi:hypothetical protein